MSEPRVRISPPQYTLWRQLAYTFGADPEIYVCPPTEKCEITTIEIGVRGNRAPSVAGVLKKFYDFGGIKVRILVVDEEGKMVLAPDETEPDFSVSQMIETALYANPYFYQLVAVPKVDEAGMSITAMFYPKAIQFWNDDISDLFGFAHFVAQDAFAEVMRREYREGSTLNFTTIAPRTFL